MKKQITIAGDPDMDACIDMGDGPRGGGIPFVCAVQSGNFVVELEEDLASQLFAQVVLEREA